MKKIRVAHILLSLEPGGMERGVVKLINEIDEKFSLSIICLEKSGILEEEIERGRKSVFSLGRKPGFIHSFILPLRLALLFRREKFDIIHTHNFLTYLYGTLGAILARTPHIIHGEHGDLPLYKGKKAFILWRKFLHNFTDAFYSVSLDLKKQAIESFGIEPEKIRVIPNGVDIEKFKPMNSSPFRERMGIDKEEFVIGAIGRMNYLKNYPFLISILPEIIRKFSSVRVFFAGDGEEKGKLMQMVKNLGMEKHVQFLGYRKDILSIYQCIDVLVQPSITEGMCNSILEAMACGKPVIASRVGGNPELILDGITGYLFPPGRKDILIEKISSLILDREKRLEMGREARKRVEENFSLKKMVEGYENLYLSVYHGNY